MSNIVLAHVLAAATIVFPPPQPRACGGSSPGETQRTKKVKTEKRIPPPPPKVERKTVYHPPTEEDLARVREELELSDPLPPITTDDGSQWSAKQVQSVIISTEQLLEHRERQLEAAKKEKKESDELAEAFASFAQRLEQRMRWGAAPLGDTSQIETYMPSLGSLLGRTAFVDLGRNELMQLFMLAIQDLRWLLSEEDEPNAKAQKTALLLNVNNTLLAAVTNGARREAGSTCQESYFTLDEHEVSAEFLPAWTAAKKSIAKEARPKRSAPPAITNETARESHLHERMEQIKSILSRRDPASLGTSAVVPSPIGDEGVDGVRSLVAPMATALRTKRTEALAREGRMTDYWSGRVEALVGRAGGGDGDGRELCASPELVTRLVAGGLDAIRRRDDLRSSLSGLALAPLAPDPNKSLLLAEKVKEAVVPEINYASGHGGPPSQLGASSRKSGRKSVSYAIDGPLLSRGMAGWIDAFVDSISGYNDHVDLVIDWAMGDEEGSGSVGTSMAAALLKAARKIPFPSEEYVGRAKRAGILSGRTRVLLEE